MKYQYALILGLSALALTHTSHAVDLDAGDYDYVPSGTQLAILYYQHAERGSQYIGSSKVNNHPQLDSDIGIARYVHYMDFAGIQIAPQILVPFGRLNAKKDIRALGSTDGLGDIILANTFFLSHKAETKSHFGITSYLYLPTGEYSKDDALNLGENRWKLNLQAAYTTQLAEKLKGDIAADITFYGKNDDIQGGGSLKQDLGYQLQSNLRYQFHPKFDLRAGISYADFGDVKVNGVTSAANTQSKFWVGTAFMPSPTVQIIADYGQDIKVENGFKEDDRINLRFLKAF